MACKCPHHEEVGKGGKIKMDKMGGAYDTWETGNAYREMGGEPEGRPRCSLFVCLFSHSIDPN